MDVIQNSSGKNWQMYHADCVEVTNNFSKNSIDYSIYSPPFSNLYTYSDSPRDMGNCHSNEEFFKQFNFLAKELFRIIKPGRLMSFHCMNIPLMKERDGYIGIQDFRGDLIRIFQRVGFIFHSEVTIWKDPLIEATRTKALGLMHKQLCKDSSMCRQGLPDYLITMRKPGENKDKINHKNGLNNFIGKGKLPPGNISHNIWRKYASPIWMDIRQTNTLNFKMAKDKDDERHICPLQLDVIERALILWSKKEDTILSPFAGIGSEGVMSIKMNRKFIGIELKKSYYDAAIKNLKSITEDAQQESIFD